MILKMINNKLKILLKKKNNFYKKFLNFKKIKIITISKLKI